MVEAPRIRILYENIKFTKNKKIVYAAGASYRKIGIDIVGYTIKKWWFAGKYIYTRIIHDTLPEYVIRTHMMMYGKIIINDEYDVSPRLIPFLILELNDMTKLTWYLTQIKILDPNCSTDMIKSNYTTCSSKKSIDDSFKLMKYDITNNSYNASDHMKHLLLGKQKHSDDMIVDFLLNQKYFPGVGNILQQEILYQCKVLPSRLLITIDNNTLSCLVDALKNLTDKLYQSYLDKQNNKPHDPILQIYHKSYCPLGHKTQTKIIGYHERRTTWCPICQQ